MMLIQECQALPSLLDLHAAFRGAGPCERRGGSGGTLASAGTQTEDRSDQLNMKIPEGRISEATCNRELTRHGRCVE